MIKYDPINGYGYNNDSATSTLVQYNDYGSNIAFSNGMKLPSTLLNSNRTSKLMSQ